MNHIPMNAIKKNNIAKYKRFIALGISSSLLSVFISIKAFDRIKPLFGLENFLKA